MKTALSIAGSDTSGGAGIHGPVTMKTMTMNTAYLPWRLLTAALTAQNKPDGRISENILR